MIRGIFDTGKAWFWNDSKINSLIEYEIFGLNKLITAKGNLLIFKHSHHLELDSRILGMHCELYGVERVHNSPYMQKVQSMGRLKGVNAIADKNSPITFIKWLKKNKTVLYAIDQDYGLKNSSNVDFFGIKTATTNAPVKIVDATQCKVLFLNSYYDSEKLILSVEEISISDSKLMIQEISSHIEARIRERPSEYLWQHRRFKSTLGKESFYERLVRWV
jgi:Lauroyl/myristoyl acyltransferase